MQALGLLSCSMSREVRHRVIEGDGPEGYDPKGGGPEGDGPEGDVVSNIGTFLNVSDFVHSLVEVPSSFQQPRNKPSFLIRH